MCLFIKKGRVLAIVGESDAGRVCFGKSISEAFATKCKNKRGQHLCERDRYHLLQGKGDAETGAEEFFYDLSDPMTSPESNY